jgi:hypothetical protein
MTANSALCHESNAAASPRRLMRPITRASTRRTLLVSSACSCHVSHARASSRDRMRDSTFNTTFLVLATSACSTSQAFQAEESPFWDMRPTARRSNPFTRRASATTACHCRKHRAAERLIHQKTAWRRRASRSMPFVAKPEWALTWGRSMASCSRRLAQSLCQQEAGSMTVCARTDRLQRTKW